MGLMKWDRLWTCRDIPLGSSREDTALSAVSLWCRAWSILKYTLSFPRVGPSGAMYRVCVGGGGRRGRVEGGGGLCGLSGCVCGCVGVGLVCSVV